MNKERPENEETPREVEALQVNAAVLGERVRKLRNERNLTIAELANRSGLSSGLISQIERGRSNPSVRTLQRLHSALGVNMWAFLQPSESNTAFPAVADGGAGATSGSPYFIRRKADRLKMVRGKSRNTEELLSPRSDDQMRFLMITIPAGGEGGDMLIGQGCKGGCVFSGRARLTVDGEIGELEPGDSFQFPADVPHEISNPYGEPVVLFWIMSFLDPHL